AGEGLVEPVRKLPARPPGADMNVTEVDETNRLLVDMLRAGVHRRPSLPGEEIAPFSGARAIQSRTIAELMGLLDRIGIPSLTAPLGYCFAAPGGICTISAASSPARRLQYMRIRLQKGFCVPCPRLFLSTKRKKSRFPSDPISAKKRGRRASSSTRVCTATSTVGATACAGVAMCWSRRALRV